MVEQSRQPTCLSPLTSGAAMPPKASSSTSTSLPVFIQDLVASGLTGVEAMATAKSLWLHDVRSKEALKSLTAAKLEHAGVDDPAVTKKLLAFAERKGKVPRPAFAFAFILAQQRYRRQRGREEAIWIIRYRRKRQSRW